MTSLGQLVANSLWFAYDALDQQKLGMVPKSQLKVLTQNIGVLLTINRRVESCIVDYLSVPQLTYEQFLYFLTYEVFAEVDDGSRKYSELKRYHDDLDRTFWLLGRPGFVPRHEPVFSDDALYKMFRIFCLLADRVSEKGALTQVTLHRGEVEDITRCLVTELGREFDLQDFTLIAVMIPAFTLPVLITFLESRYLQEVENPALETAVDEIYQMFIEQVLEKGKLFQKLPFAPLWVSREVQLLQWELRPCRSPAGLLQSIHTKLNSGPLAKLTKKTALQKIQDSAGARPCRFTLSSDDNKLLHLAAPDHRTKTRWLRALDEAIAHSETPLPYQKVLASLRKEERTQEEEKEIEEKIRRASQADIIEQTQAELIAERLARVEAEEAAREEAEARAKEERRVKELTTLRQELEELLKQETQAKRDEEIVRNLQARVLREEWEKREELERLQKEQNLLLEEEKKKREAFERIQQDKERQLVEAQKKLQKLEADRMKLDHELRNAREKIVLSERGKEIIEARMKVKERSPPVRTYSLRPVRREQRAIPLRSSSFNTHTHMSHKISVRTPPSSQTGSSSTVLQQEETHQNDAPLRSSSDSIHSNHAYNINDSLESDGCSETKEEGYHSHSGSPRAGTINGSSGKIDFRESPEREDNFQQLNQSCDDGNLNS